MNGAVVNSNLSIRKPTLFGTGVHVVAICDHAIAMLTFVFAVVASEQTICLSPHVHTLVRHASQPWFPRFAHEPRALHVSTPPPIVYLTPLNAFFIAPNVPLAADAQDTFRCRTLQPDSLCLIRLVTLHHAICVSAERTTTWDLLNRLYASFEVIFIRPLTTCNAISSPRVETSPLCLTRTALERHEWVSTDFDNK